MSGSGLYALSTTWPFAVSLGPTLVYSKTLGCGQLCSRRLEGDVVGDQGAQRGEGAYQSITNAIDRRMTSQLSNDPLVDLVLFELARLRRLLIPDVPVELAPFPYWTPSHVLRSRRVCMYLNRIMSKKIHAPTRLSKTGWTVVSGTVMCFWNRTEQTRTLCICYGHIDHEVRVSEIKLEQYDHYDCQADRDDSASDG